jgi:hypothetical protein
VLPQTWQNHGQCTRCRRVKKRGWKRGGFPTNKLRPKTRDLMPAEICVRARARPDLIVHFLHSSHVGSGERLQDTDQSIGSVRTYIRTPASPRRSGKKKGEGFNAEARPSTKRAGNQSHSLESCSAGGFYGKHKPRRGGLRTPLVLLLLLLLPSNI